MKFLVKKQQIDCIERDKLADGQIAFVSFRFVFDNEWEGLYKVVQFMQGENTYNISLGVDGYSCKMPSELQAGCAEMSLFGYAPDDETALRATTAPIKLRIEQSGFSSSGSEVVPPTPDLYQQLIAKIDEKIASVHDGADGASAYEIAVENGYTGTEAEWLSSLKGEKGDAGEQGIQGIQGEKGDTGEQGLQGIQGEKGEKGEKGDTGAAGKDGMNGTDGRDGANGFSPTATVTETDAGAVISITDKNGTTTATVKNGTSGTSVDLSDYAKKADVATAIESAHTHTNKDFLDGIEAYLNSTYSKVTAEREAADNNLATRIKALEDSVGDISTLLATMVEV